MTQKDIDILENLLKQLPADVFRGYWDEEGNWHMCGTMTIKANTTIRKKNIPKKGDFVRFTSTGRAARISNNDESEELFGVYIGNGNESI